MPTASGHTTAIRASRVIGTAVKDNGGNVIGKIEDLILDKMDNAIMFAVVGFGGAETCNCVVRSPARISRAVRRREA